MKFFIMIAAFIGSIISVRAQTFIKGRVYDNKNNSPLAGANITFHGKGGTTTDKDGYFSIECGKTNKITITFLGYESNQVNIKNCNEELSIGMIPSSTTMNAVEITATSTENKTLLYQPSSITKLGLPELKRGLGVFLDDAINTNVPGVTMNRRAVSSGQQFNIRGYGNGTRGTAGISSNFDGQGYKVYLNGIPVTDAEGITLMDDIDFASVGNVEVVKGPSGTLYGLAIAGVVNLKTIKPEKGKTSIGQDVLVGNYGLRRYTTHFQYGGERSSLLINYGKQETDGYMAHTNSDKTFVNIAGDFQVNPKQSVSTYFGFSNSYDQRGGELSIPQYEANDYSGNPAYIKNNAHSEIVGFRTGISHTYFFTNNVSNTTTVFGSGVSNNSSSAAGWTDKDPINYGLRSTFDTKLQISSGIRLGGVTGVETQHQRAQTIGYAMTADSNNLSGYNRIGTMRSNQFTISGTTSVFTEWTLGLPGELSITAGLGWSNMKIELNDRFYSVPTNRAPTQYKRTFDNMLSPHVAINKVFNKQVSMYGAYSKGFKAPASSYFFIPQTGQVNLGLNPEEGDQFEVGTKGSFLNNKLSYQLALFDAIFSDKMTTVPVTSGT
ncbi:MAG: TonB-dependent receptor, partial [Flavisolibacter sp.]